MTTSEIQFNIEINIYTLFSIDWWKVDVLERLKLSENLIQWGYINKKQPPKSLLFRHVALTLSHLNFNLTIHHTLPYFLHSHHIPSSIYHYHPLFHIQLTISILYSHLSPFSTTPTHNIYHSISIYPTLNYYLSPF